MEENEKFEELRQRAIDKLKDHKESSEDLAGKDARLILEELRIHQLELQMQNEDLKQTQQQLNLTLNLFRRLFTFAPVGYITCDRNGIIQRANIIARRMLDNEDAFLENKPVRQYIHSAYQLLFSGIFSTAAEGKHSSPIEVALKNKNGIGHVQLDLRALDITEDHETGNEKILITLTDVTALHDLQRELEVALEKANQANTVKRDFLGVMSHELKTPLNAIIGFNNLALWSDSEEERNEYLANMSTSAEHLLILINDVLDITKMESKSLELHNETFNLHETIKLTHSIFLPRAREKGLDITLNIDKHVPILVESDRERIRQVLFNLVSNAVKYTDSGFISIDVTGEQSPSIPGELKDVTIQITDTGIGIPNDNIDKIFEVFYQVPAHERREGTGLGLSITSQLIDLLSGKITHTHGDPAGSIFSVTIPLKVKTSYAKTEKTNTRDLKLRKPITVLCVEDNEVNLRILESYLARLGAEPHRAQTGNEALEMVQGTSYGAIFMDLELPDMNGLEVSHAIRSGKAGTRNKSTPIIAVTAHSLTEYRDMSLTHGMDDFISKPVDIRDIYASLTRILEKQETGSKG